MKRTQPAHRTPEGQVILSGQSLCIPQLSSRAAAGIPGGNGNLLGSSATCPTRDSVTFTPRAFAPPDADEAGRLAGQRADVSGVGEYHGPGETRVDSTAVLAALLPRRTSAVGPFEIPAAAPTMW